jgi:hypothetical protein
MCRSAGPDAGDPASERSEWRWSSDESGRLIMTSLFNVVVGITGGVELDVS